jgi:hypothetical protein
MKPRDYCCCAIPILNAGIYLTLLEQFTTALLVGILSLATPSSKENSIQVSALIYLIYQLSELLHHPLPLGFLLSSALWRLQYNSLVLLALQKYGPIYMAWSVPRLILLW